MRAHLEAEAETIPGAHEATPEAAVVATAAAAAFSTFSSAIFVRACVAFTFWCSLPEKATFYSVMPKVDACIRVACFLFCFTLS